jgi:hypothetical protein
LDLGGNAPGPDEIDGAVKSLACCDIVLYWPLVLVFYNLSFFFFKFCYFFITNYLSPGKGETLLVLKLTIWPKSRFWWATGGLLGVKVISEFLFACCR